jgi:hypothetical protein
MDLPSLPPSLPPYLSVIHRLSHVVEHAHGRSGVEAPSFLEGLGGREGGGGGESEQWRRKRREGGREGEREGRAYLDHALTLGDVREQPQFELSVVGHNERLVGFGNKGLANFVLVLCGGREGGREGGGVETKEGGWKEEGEGGREGGRVYLLEGGLVLEIGSTGGKTACFGVEIQAAKEGGRERGREGEREGGENMSGWDRMREGRREGGKGGVGTCSALGTCRRPALGGGGGSWRAWCQCCPWSRGRRWRYKLLHPPVCIEKIGLKK